MTSVSALDSRCGASQVWALVTVLSEPEHQQEELQEWREMRLEGWFSGYSTGCPSREPGLDPQSPHSVCVGLTTVSNSSSRESDGLSALCRYQACMWFREINADKTPEHVEVNMFLKEKGLFWLMTGRHGGRNTRQLITQHPQRGSREQWMLDTLTFSFLFCQDPSPGDDAIHT